MKDFKKMKISIPPLSLQNDFAQKVEIILMEENYKSIMDRAFKGQLFN